MMIEEDKAAKFGYKKFTPYPELIHSIGLLHTARQVDVEFALSNIKSILKQKFDSYCITIIYDSSRGGKNVFVSKTFKAGKNGLSERLKKSLSYGSFVFNSELSAVVGEFSSEGHDMARLMQSITYSSLACHFRAVLVFDATRNSCSLFMKPRKASSNKQTCNKYGN